jgi:hypothetical protein
VKNCSRIWEDKPRVSALSPGQAAHFSNAVPFGDQLGTLKFYSHFSENFEDEFQYSGEVIVQNCLLIGGHSV